MPQRFEPFLAALRGTPLAAWAGPLYQLAAARLQPARHGDLDAWIEALAQLPVLPPGTLILDQPCVGLIGEQPLPAALSAQLRQALDQLHPWRKGPFCLQGIKIDAEWRSDWKWARLAEAISPLMGRRLLDVGCGNGYYGLRALGAGAELVLGIDPTPRFVLQFLALEQLMNTKRLAVFPLADDDLPGLCAVAAGGFDTLFSMGVLYHRRDPLQHLARLRDCLRPGGELVLETLVTDRPESERAVEALASTGTAAASRPSPSCPLLRPPGRYARMRNLHAIPSIATLVDWLEASGFSDIQLVDLSRTTTDEQRSTPWMRFQSLADFLDPQDPRLTIEGHPAPVRALLLARMPL